MRNIFDVQHIIKKQIIQLQIDSRLDAFHLQHIVSEHFWAEVIPILQKVFDSITNENEIIRLDRLEIDLGLISVKDIEKGEWVTKLGEILQKELAKQLRENHPSRLIHRESETKSTFRQWLYYMENGYLPWNVIEINEEWYEKTLQTFAVDFNSVTELRRLLQSNDLFIWRIILQHPESFLISLVEILTAEKQDQLARAVNELWEIFYFLEQKIKTEVRQLPSAIQNKRNFVTHLWKTILQVAAQNEKGTTTVVLAEKILFAHYHEYPIIKKIKRELGDKIKITLPILIKLQEKCIDPKKKDKTNPGAEKKQGKEKRKIKPNESGEYGPSSANNENNTTKNGTEADNKHAGVNPVPGGRETDPPSSTGEEKISNKTNQSSILHNDKQDDPITARFNDFKNVLTETGNYENVIASNKIDEDGIFVQYAGTILLHPFLSMFFKRMGWVSEGRFIDGVAHQKALHLLYYMATGNRQPQEYELTIAKILCAYPLQWPVETILDIDETALQEADDLLAAVIAQWEILKNSSVTALRESFLQRNGKLFSKNNKLFLQVEKNAIDVLLDHLTWNISIIKLPWISEILSVEWR